MGNLVVDVELNVYKFIIYWYILIVVVKPEMLAVDRKVLRGKTRWFQSTPMGGRQCLGSHRRPPLCLRSALKNQPCILYMPQTQLNCAYGQTCCHLSRSPCQLAFFQRKKVNFHFVQKQKIIFIYQFHTAYTANLLLQNE